MPFTTIQTPTVGQPTRLQSFAKLVVENLAFLYNKLLSLTGSREVITNGSFEADSDADGFPDGWTITRYTGGTFSHELSTLLADDKARHGKRSIKFTSPGGASQGGGYAESTDFLEVSDGRQYFLTWSHKNSVAGIHNQVQVSFYDSTQAFISTTTVYDSTANPTSWTIGYGAFTPPANARYAKVVLIGAKNDNTTAGSAWFDDIKIHEGPTPTVVVYDASTSWVCPAGVYRVRVRCWGGGGGGTNGSNNSGGGGGYGEDILQVVPGTSYAVTVGAGGTGGGSGGSSSLGSLISATGGAGGSGSRAGGTSSATVNVTGGAGTQQKIGGHAGGGGGCGGREDGQAGVRPGGGGSGATVTAGNGADGRVIIEYLK